jgi:hypothetical protein
MENQPTPKPPKAFASIAQMERCRTLVAEGTMTQERFDACAGVTDIPNLPERLHPKKEKPESHG